MAPDSFNYLWLQSEEELFEEAITYEEEDTVETKGFRTWNEVARQMTTLADERLEVIPRNYDAMNCQIHYNLFTVFTLARIPLSYFALEQPPWQRKEINHVLSLLHHSWLGGEAADPELSWKEIAEQMQKEDKLKLPYLGPEEDSPNWERKYTEYRVFLAWKAYVHMNRNFFTDAEKEGAAERAAANLKDLKANPVKWAFS